MSTVVHCCARQHWQCQVAAGARDDIGMFLRGPVAGACVCDCGRVVLLFLLVILRIGMSAGWVRIETASSLLAG